MTTLTAPSDRTSARAVTGLGIAAFAISIVATAVGAHDWAEIAVIGAITAVATILVFGLVVPRALRKESAGGTALALSIPALLLVVPAFWSGLPFMLGVAGAVVGNAGRQAPKGAGTCIVGLVLGALAAVAYVAIYVSDVTAGGSGFLFD